MSACLFLFCVLFYFHVPLSFCSDGSFELIDRAVVLDDRSVQRGGGQFGIGHRIEVHHFERGDAGIRVVQSKHIVPFFQFEYSFVFNTAVELEEKITAGQIIGTVNGKELKSPVDGTVTSIAPSNESVPSNYPVAIVHYTGFALNVEADNFLSTLPEYAELKAKFQVYDGVGPTDMIAVVSPAADENAFTGIVPQEGILQCLISQTVDVKSGQSATVVITATTRNDVLILPLSVIAGRQGTGLVTVITPNGERVETKVTLGVTDGANIEILSGLEEGDVVSATPPNLDPRGN